MHAGAREHELSSDAEDAAQCVMRVTSVHKRKVARRRSSHAQTDSTEAQPSRAYGRTYPSMLRHACGQSGATPPSASALWTTSCTWPGFWLVARILLLLPRCSLPLLLCGWCAGGGGGAPASIFGGAPASIFGGAPASIFGGRAPASVLVSRLFPSRSPSGIPTP